MNAIEIINKRKSIRGYKADPVSKEILSEILLAAGQAPSAMNTQPWEFIVLTGEVLETISREVVERLNSGEENSPDHQVVGWSKESVYRTRQVELAKQIFKIMDIPREDKEKRSKWLERGFRFFDAPAAILIVTDRSLAESAPLLDLGAAMQNICLAALDYDLGTCIEDQSILYPEIIRKHTGMEASKRIIIAIAIGYPDWDFPANELESNRQPLDSTTKWLGFE